MHETDPAEQSALASFAKDDPDARVRRAAIARLTDTGALADIARNESDGGVRDHALAQLVERASKHDAAQATPAVSALIALGRERELGQLAKAAGPESIRRQAVEALRDQKVLGSVARHARRSRGAHARGEPSHRRG